MNTPATTADALRAGPPSPQDGGRALRAWMRQKRDEEPVWRDPRGVYHVFRYDSVQRVLMDHRAFSSDRTRLMPANGQLGKGNLTMMDPPEHRTLRSLVSQSFTPKMVAALEPRITQVAQDLLDQVDVEHFDLVQRLAHPMPVIVIAELLGVPVSDRELFRAWSAGFGRGELKAMEELNDYLLARVREARQAPREDLISKMIAANVDGKRLDDEEIASLAGLLLLAGHITTTVLIGNAVLCLEENPSAAAELRADRRLIPPAIEEVLRYRPAFTQMGRISTTDTELDGRAIPAGRLVLAWLLSANHDERVFAEPDRFDLHRRPNRQSAFGHGIHFCLGAPLARLEARIAVEQLLRRYRSLQVASGARLSFYEHPTCALKGLPVQVG
jgi:erythromycin 12 hydroxylase